MNYWKDKAIRNDGKIILEKRASITNYQDSIPVIEDWIIPKCWACGEIVNLPVKEHEKYDDIEINKIWNSAEVRRKLQKCHIVPAALDGEDTPENAFLMCKKCHLESPDTINKEAFFRWVYIKRKKNIYGHPFQEMLKDVDADLQARGLPTMNRMLIEYPDMDLSDIQELLSKKVSCHGAEVVDSSIVIGLADILAEKWTEYKKKM